MDSKELSKLAKELAPLVAQEILKGSCERIIEDIFEDKKKREIPEDLYNPKESLVKNLFGPKNGRTP